MSTRHLGLAATIAIMISAPIVYLGCMGVRPAGQTGAPTPSGPSASSTSSSMPSALPAPSPK